MSKFIDNVKTILLDVDDTIMDFEKGQKKAIFLSCAELGYTCTEEQYDEYDLINKKYWKMFERGEIEKHRLIYARFEEFFSRFGIDGDPVAMENIYQVKLGEQYFFWEGAEEGVKYLKEKYPIYIVTNGIQMTQANRLRLSGIDKIASGVFISEAVGAGKPSKKFFDYVFEHTGIDRETAVIMGDSLTSDILGGINAGIRTVWFNAKHKLPIAEIKPDYEIKSWEEVKEIL